MATVTIHHGSQFPFWTNFGHASIKNDWAWAWRDLEFLLTYEARFDSPSAGDQRASDLSLKRHTARWVALNGVVSRIDGYGVDYDGSTSRINYAKAQFDFGSWSEITMIAYVTSDTTSGTGNIMGQWEFPSSTGFFMARNGSTLRWNIEGKAGIQGGTFAANTFHHCACTYSDASGAMRVYLDGSEVNNSTGLSGNLPVTDGADFQIGAQNDGANKFNGRMFFNGMWRREWTATEILRHSQNIHGMLEPEPSIRMFNIQGLVPALDTQEWLQPVAQHEQVEFEMIPY